MVYGFQGIAGLVCDRLPGLCQSFCRACVNRSAGLVCDRLQGITSPAIDCRALQGLCDVLSDIRGQYAEKPHRLGQGFVVVRLGPFRLHDYFLPFLALIIRKQAPFRAIG